MEKVLTKCLICHEQIVTTQKRLDNGHGKFCSRDCLYENKRNKLDRECATCLKLFTEIPSRVKDGRGKFCSRNCYSKSKIGSTGYWKGKKRSTPWMLGENNHAWTGGFTSSHYSRKKKVGGTYTQTEWFELKKKYNFMCLCCKAREPFIKLTVDHIVPLSIWDEWAKENNPIYEGNSIANIQPLCLSCNCSKQANVQDFRYNGTDWLTVFAEEQ